MKWFQIVQKTNKTDKAGASLDVVMDGEIGRGWFADDSIASGAFMREINAQGELSAINIKLNSPGGSVSDGLAIANYLRDHKAKVTITVMGQASSIASVIASAADEVIMGTGAWMLVHQPWTVAIGNSDEMRSIAGDLDAINNSIMEVYNLRVPQDKQEEFAALVKAESILNADQCIEFGLADSKSADIKAAASIGDFTTAMKHAIDEVNAKKAQPSPPTDQNDPVMTVESLRAEYPDLVQEIEHSASSGTTADESAVVAARMAERKRVTGIIKQCRSAGQPQLIDRLVSNGMEGQSVGDYILDVAAAASDRAGIIGQQSSGLNGDGNTQEEPINPTEIYNRRRLKGQAK